LNPSTNYQYLITAHNDNLAATTRRPGFFVRTYGCQMNSRDSEKLTALLLNLGYEPAASQEAADFILYNTCCVRESAEDKVFGHLGRLKRVKKDRPHLMIAVSGCMTQQEETAKKFQEKYPYVDIVFGTSNRHKLPEFIWRTMEMGKQVVDISGIDDTDITEITDVSVTTREFSHKAGVNIMVGCNNFCAYCIVPYVRGREKSRPMADILKEIEAFAADGVKEIMLLGQNVNSYTGGFPELLHRANNIDGIERIRFMTSHPKDFSDALIAAVRDLPKLCKSVHLPLQSGSTKVLQDMNRQYTQTEYLTLAEKLISAGIALSTDIIVGYPGETDADFEETLTVARKIRFSGAFTFLYSKRSGTPAANRTDTIDSKTASERFDRLIAEVYPIMLEINQAKIGQTLEVMVEDAKPDTTYKGRADDHTLVHFTASDALHPGDIVPVNITEAKTFYVSGKTKEI